MNIAKMNYPVSDNLKRIMNEKGLVQKWVAEQAGFSRIDVTNMVTNRRIIKPQDISKLSIVMGVDINELFKDTKHTA